MRRLSISYPTLLSLLFLAASFSAIETAALSQSITLTDVTASSGVAFKHTDGGSGRHIVVETVSAGLALFDYDSDGDIDLYFLSGAPLKGTVAETPPRNALYRNDGDFKFTDVTAESGTGDTGYGLGVAVADYDADGHLDIYLNNHGPNVLYRNLGNGKFRDVTKEAGVGAGDKTGAGTCFLDMDGDGDLDLYVANYLFFDYDKIERQLNKGVEVYPNPRYYDPAPDTLFRNNGDGTFTDVSAASGVAAHAGWGMGIVCGDYDNDGDTDVFIGNDVAENFLFQNDGAGNFEEVALVSGTAYDLHGDEQGSMGVDCGDFNNDGWLDFYVTSYQSQLATLYQNTADGFFDDVTMLTGAGAGTFHHVTWGNGFVDFDRDGDRDIFVARGHLQDNIDRIDDSTDYKATNLLLQNSGSNKFTDISATAGDGFISKRCSRGAAFDDLDNDGDVDAVILNSRDIPTILRNDSKNSNHWIQLRLRGVKTNINGIGAHVKVVAGDLVQYDEVHSGRSYQSHYGTRLYFGLGEAKAVEKIEIDWVGGKKQTVLNPPIDGILDIRETP